VLSRIPRDIIKNMKCPLLLSHFNQTYIFSTYFGENSDVKFCQKQVVLRGRTDKTKLMSLFEILQRRRHADDSYLPLNALA
jgi:hypothetical protein